MKAALYIAGAIALMAASGHAGATTTTVIGSKEISYTAHNGATCTVGPASTSSVDLTGVFNNLGVPSNAVSPSDVTISASCNLGGVSVGVSTKNGGLTLGGLPYNQQGDGVTATPNRVNYLSIVKITDNSQMPTTESAQIKTSDTGVGAGTSKISNTISNPPKATDPISLNITTIVGDAALPVGDYKDTITVTVSLTQ